MPFRGIGKTDSKRIGDCPVHASEFRGSFDQFLTLYPVSKLHVRRGHKDNVRFRCRIFNHLGKTGHFFGNLSKRRSHKQIIAPQHNDNGTDGKITFQQRTVNRKLVFRRDTESVFPAVDDFCFRIFDQACPTDSLRVTCTDIGAGIISVGVGVTEA